MVADGVSIASVIVCLFFPAGCIRTHLPRPVSLQGDRSMTDKRILNPGDTERSDHESEERERADSGYSRAYTRVLTSTLFDILDYVSPDDHEWTQGVLKDLGKVEVKGPEGDVPEQPPFAKDIVFWVMLACASFLGVAMGFAGLIFLNIIDEVRVSQLQNERVSFEGIDLT
jgi:hypothetical protein